jgi:hypothetical protein
MYRQAIIIFIVLIGLLSICSAQPELVTEETLKLKHKRQAGVVLAMAETGSGIGGFMVWPVFGNFHIGPTIDFFFLRDSRQIDYYDPYYNIPVSYGKENNAYLLDLLITVKRRFFRDSLDDSFRPFITGAAGFIYGMNFPEDIPDFPRRDEFSLTFGGFFGAGVDICVGARNLVSVRAQYRVMPFTTRIGETSNHSMFELRFEIGQRF